jgi:hypothetical protein
LSSTKGFVRLHSLGVETHSPTSQSPTFESSHAMIVVVSMAVALVNRVWEARIVTLVQ